MTQQGNLQCKKIIHVSAKNNLATIQKCVRQALEMCVKHGFTSIAFPAFGTGEFVLTTYEKLCTDKMYKDLYSDA